VGQPFWDDWATKDSSYGVGVPEQLGREFWSVWDKMTIGGLEVPGHVEVHGRKTRRTDVRSAAGNSLASLTNLGYDPTEIDITITLWTPGQFADYEVLLAKVQPKPLPPKSTIFATSEANFQIIVSYSEAPNLAAGTPQVDTLVGCRFKGFGQNFKQGPEVIVVKLPFTFMNVLVNGVPLLSATTILNATT
jgi:hypothetical protein